MLYHIIAIIRASDLESIEEALQRLNVSGISVTHCKGYGEYKNFFSGDWMKHFVRIEIFTTRSEEISTAIVDAASSGLAGDGIVAVSPVDKVIRIRDKCPVTNGES